MALVSAAQPGPEEPQRSDPAVPSYGPLFDEPAAAEGEHTGVVDSGPLRVGPRVDTGRLYRSAGAGGPAATSAIPALAKSPEPVYALGGTPDPGSDAGAGPERDAPRASALWAAAAAEDSASVAADSPDITSGDAAPAAHGRGAPRHAAKPRSTDGTDVSVTQDDTAGLTSMGVVVVVVGVTVMLAFGDAVAGGGDRLGLVTGIGLLASSVYAAISVRLIDLWTAVLTPPLAYLAAILTAGQLTLPAGGSLLTREAWMVFWTLSFNAPWVLGSTAAALVIVLIRRRLGGSQAANTSEATQRPTTVL